jgi:Tol biopolymer transport system component
LRLRSCGVAATLVVAACSSSSTGPRANPDVFLAGNHQSDTVFATLPQQLVVRIKIPSGQSPSGHVVRFASPPDTNPNLSNLLFGNQVYFGPGSQPVDVTWNDTTSTAAEVSVIITLGAQGGTVPVVITVPEFGYVDTATFTVLPGGAAMVVAAPADTAMYTGTSFKYHSYTADRYGNPRTDNLNYAVDSGPVTMSGATATAGVLGYATVAIVSPKYGFTANATIAVVPHGTLAASTGQSIVTFNLDGSGRQTIVQAAVVGYLKWDPAGTHIAYDGTVPCSGDLSWFSTTDLHGNTQRIVDGAGFQGGNYDDQYPSYSHDGTWIYYSQVEQAGEETGRLRRVHIDGSGDTLVLGGGLNYYPAPAPDNIHVAYVAASYNYTSGLGVLDVTTGVADTLGVSAWSPEWSPTGNQIAFLTPLGCTGNIAVISPTGGTAHVLSSATYQAGFDWSPDGQWIVAANATTGILNLINATTGQTIPLSYAKALGSPAWQPGSSPSTNRVSNKLGHK